MKSIIDAFVTEMNTVYEDGVMKAVQSVGFDVDKERLLKALTDSRSFYDEGYSDATMKYKNEWIPCSERFPEKEGRYLCQCSMGYNIPFYMLLYWSNNLEKTDEYDFYGRNYSGFYYCDSEWGNVEQDDVVAWMELPAPYEMKGEEADE